jgi:uncharacterized membrane protein
LEQRNRRSLGDNRRLQRTVQELGADTKLFASSYLIVHGLIKVFLVAGLLSRRLWSYSFSLWFLAVFIACQTYRFFFTHSLWLIALNILDLIVAFLIWREYQVRKVSRAVQLPAQQ